MSKHICCQFVCVYLFADGLSFFLNFQKIITFQFKIET